MKKTIQPLKEHLQSVYLTEEQIQGKVKEAAAWLDSKFEGKTPLAAESPCFRKTLRAA